MSPRPSFLRCKAGVCALAALVGLHLGAISCGIGRPFLMKSRLSKVCVQGNGRELAAAAGSYGAEPISWLTYLFDLHGCVCV